MRLFEITEPDPRHAELADRAEKVYERLYDAVLDLLAGRPPRGGEVRRDRRAIVFPYGELVGEQEDEARRTSPAYRVVDDVLRRLGWETDWDMYLEGTAKRSEEYVVPDSPRARRSGAVPGEKRLRERRMRIGRILDQAMRDPKALEASGSTVAEIARAKTLFENDPARRGVAGARRGDERVIVISFDPVEAAHMTARRKWGSCWRIGGAQESRFRQALRCGIATAWLTTRDDIEGGNWLDNPTARWLVVPYVDPVHRTVVSLRPVTDPYHVYGTRPPAADRAVAEAVRRIDDALRAIVGARVAKRTVRGVREEMPEIEIPVSRDDPAWVVYVLLHLPRNRWRIEIDRVRRPTGGIDAVLDAIRRAARIGADPRATEELANAVAGRARPRRQRVADVVLALAAFGLVPPETVPPPEVYVESFCPVLQSLPRPSLEYAENTIRRVWKDDDAKLAAILAYLGGCAPLPAHDLAADRDEALALIARVRRRRGRVGQRVAVLEELLRAGDPTLRRTDRDIVELAAKILMSGRGAEKIGIRDAIVAPEAVVTGDLGPVREEVENSARVAMQLAWAAERNRRPSDAAASLATAYRGKDLPEILRLVVREAEKMETPPPWVDLARRIAGVFDPELRGPGGIDWETAKALLWRDVVDADDILPTLDARELSRLPESLRSRLLSRAVPDEIPLALRLAALLASTVPDSLIHWMIGTTELDDIDDALRRVAEHGTPVVAERARRLLELRQHSGRVRPGSDDVVPAAVLAVVGYLDPEVVAGALAPGQWSALAGALDDAEGERRSRLIDVLARSSPAPDSIANIHGFDDVVSLARSMVRYGTPVAWDRMRPRDWDYRPVAWFVAAYERAGGRMPDDIPMPHPQAIAAATRLTNGVDEPPVSRWIRRYAEKLAEDVRQRGPSAVDPLARSASDGYVPQRVVRAIVDALPPDIRGDVTERARNWGLRLQRR